MASRAFKNFIKFIMCGLKVSDYTVKYKIVIDYDLDNNKLNTIANLTQTNSGLIDSSLFYETIKDYNFMDNKRVIEGELQQETYEIPGGAPRLTSIPDNISFELEDYIQKILNIPIYVEYKQALKKNRNNSKKINRLKNFNQTYINSKNRTDFTSVMYEKAFKLIDTEYLNDATYVLQMPAYEKEQCEYANHNYKYTFGAFIYLENNNYVCPICYSQSINPHVILDNFRIDWDSVGVVSLKGKQ